MSKTWLFERLVGSYHTPAAVCLLKLQDVRLGLHEDTIRCDTIPKLEAGQRLPGVAAAARNPQIALYAASNDEVHDRLGLDKNNKYSVLSCLDYCLYTYRHQRRYALSLPPWQRHKRFDLQIPDRYIPCPPSCAMPQSPKIAETDFVRFFL